MKTAASKQTAATGKQAPSTAPAGEAGLAVLQTLGLHPACEFLVKGEGVIDDRGPDWHEPPPADSGTAGSLYGPGPEKIAAPYRRAGLLLADLADHGFGGPKHLAGYRLPRGTLWLLNRFVEFLAGAAEARGLSIRPSLGDVVNAALLEFIFGRLNVVDGREANAPPLGSGPLTDWRRSWLLRRGLPIQDENKTPAA